MTGAFLLSVDYSIDSWVLDSGASFHTMEHCGVMENYIAGDHGKVYLVDGEPIDIVGISDVRLKMSNRQIWKIAKVRHVPKLMMNLISVS